MVHVIARVKVQSGKEGAFKAAAEKMVAHVRDHEPDTPLYVCLQSTGDTTVFAFYEEYVSDAALASHGSSAAMKEFFGTVGGMLDGAPSIETFRQSAAKR
jgi:quinol monooxygenase YgiN